MWLAPALYGIAKKLVQETSDQHNLGKLCMICMQPQQCRPTQCCSTQAPLAIEGILNSTPDNFALNMHRLQANLFCLRTCTA